MPLDFATTAGGPQFFSLGRTELPEQPNRADFNCYALWRRKLSDNRPDLGATISAVTHGPSSHSSSSCKALGLETPVKCENPSCSQRLGRDWQDQNLKCVCDVRRLLTLFCKAIPSESRVSRPVPCLDCSIPINVNTSLLWCDMSLDSVLLQR